MNGVTDVLGKVTWVQPRRYKRNKDVEKFKVMDSRPHVNKEVTCLCSFFCPLEKGDVLYASCTQKGEIATVMKPPFVRVGTDKDSIVSFFCKQVRGWSKARAGDLYDSLERIAGVDKVDAYLSDAAEKWMKNEDRNTLTEFSDLISISNMSYLLSQWYRKFDKRRLYLLGLNNHEIAECMKGSGSCYKIYEACLNNPFVLYPIPLNKCMEIQNRLKRKPSIADVECGKIVRKMYDNLCHRAWTCTPLKYLANEFSSLSKYEKRLVSDYGVVPEFGCLYLHYAYKVEKKVTEHISRLVKSDTIKDDDPFVHPDEYNPKSPIHSRLEAEFRASANLSEDQKGAIQGALDHKIAMITGGPGVGKTFCIKEIVYNLEQRGIEYAICAFTGKAVARLREVLDSSIPMTFHLKIKKQKQIHFQHLLVDEASMVTMELFYDFIDRFDFPFHITLVGDPNQLPPIGWGSLFSQCIASKTIPMYELIINHRVYDVPGEIEGIALNSKRMAQHGSPQGVAAMAAGLANSRLCAPRIPMKFTQTRNFVLRPGNVEQIAAFAKAFKDQDIDPYEVTVITPYNRDLKTINQTFQDLYFRDSKDKDLEYVFDTRGVTWYVGDRVMMKENDYEINVMNGEEGKVIEVDVDQIKVKFGEGREYLFPLEPNPKNKKYGYSKEKNRNDNSGGERTVEKLKHSYCVSIHNAQGSEWNYVILYISYGKSHPQFINKNLIYTALTRAKRALFFVGNIEELEASTIRTLPFRSENATKRLLETLPLVNLNTNEHGEVDGDDAWFEEDYVDNDLPFDGY